MRIRVKVGSVVTVIGLLLSGTVHSAPLDDLVELVDSERTVPLVVMVTQPDCRYCDIVTQDHLTPLFKAQLYTNKALFRQVDMTSDFDEIQASVGELSGREFAQRYQVYVTPTLLFLDPLGEPVTDPLIGYSSKDYYQYYLESSIDNAIKQIN
jgi:thioredoxin-related protein